MKLIKLNYFTYKPDDTNCLHYSWQGKGRELKYGDFHKSSFIADMNCPNFMKHSVSGKPCSPKKLNIGKRNIRIGKLDNHRGQQIYIWDIKTTQENKN